MTLYKLTAPDGSPVHGGKGRWPLPTKTGKPGRWRSVKGDRPPPHLGPGARGMTDDLMDATTPPNLGAPKPKCRRHQWVPADILGATPLDDRSGWGCIRCGKVRDEARASQGRRNRARGLRIQRERNRALGITNIAGNAPNHDGGTHRDLLVTESKSCPPGKPVRGKPRIATFPEAMWALLSAIPAEAGQTRHLIITEAAGPGRKARALVVTSFDDFRDLHGEVKP